MTSQLWMLHALKRDYWRTILVSTHFTSSPSGLKTAISLKRFHRFKSPQAAKTIPDSLIVGYRPPLSLRALFPKQELRCLAEKVQKEQASGPSSEL